MNAEEVETLGNRMKGYEHPSTSVRLMPHAPVYARIDGRAFHTLCRSLHKPYSKAFVETMQETARYLVGQTSATVGFVQSDEISLGWTDVSKAPFDGRVQKLESNLASMAGARFVQYVLLDLPKTRCDDHAALYDSALRHLPSFDCRVFSLPNLNELANAFLWRENDAIKNSIISTSLSMFSDRELHRKNTDDMVHMMRMKGYCFYEDTDEAFMRGTFYRREKYERVLDEEAIEKIGKEKLPPPNGRGETVVIRSRVAKMDIRYRLTDIANRNEVLFNGEEPVRGKENVTFDLHARGKGNE